METIRKGVTLSKSVAAPLGLAPFFAWPQPFRALASFIRDQARRVNDLLKPACSHLDMWHTVYNHVMASPAAITEWFKGSSLQPFLSPLSAEDREKFLAAYTAKIEQAYKPRYDGKVLLRFPRLFIVAVR